MKGLAFRNILRRSGRSIALLLMVALLAFSMFGGTVVISSLQNGLTSLEGRIGADVIVIPTTAKSKVDMKAILLDGTTGYFYMSRDYLEDVAAIEGVDKVSGQLYLASLRASCCSASVQVIGFDPETDFSVQPWISRSYNKSLEDLDIVVGCNVSVDIGETLVIYQQKCRVVAKLESTGTAMDTAVYTTVSTVRILMDAASALGADLDVKGEPEDMISAIYIKVKEGYDPQKVTDHINVYMKKKLAAVTTKSMLTGISDSLAAISQSVRLLMIVIWVLVLFILIAAFAMMIRERKREFAVLRVLGASRAMLSRMVLSESLMLSLAGGLVGIGLAALVAFPFSGLIESSLGLPFLTPSLGTSLLLALVALAAVMIVGPVASAWTAHRLSRVDAGNALREEN